jgi:hypothetical protein
VANISGQSVVISGSSGIRLETQKGGNNQVGVGQVLAATSSSGDVEFTSAPLDTSIYKGSGNLSVNTTVDGVDNWNLTFTRLKEASIEAKTALKIRTPGVANGTLSVQGMALVAQDNTGKVEYQSVGVGAKAEYTGTAEDTSTATSPVTLWFGVKADLNPAYSGPTPEVETGTRFTAKLARPNAPGGWANTGTGGVSLNFPVDPASGADVTYSRNIVMPDGSEIPANSLKEGTLVELVYQRDWRGPPTGKWILMNCVKPSSGVFLSSLAAGVQVTSVSSVGVIDSAILLGGVPTEYRKISTLGQFTVGDGRHADYYLTAYAPGVPDTVQSRLDPTFMWKKLVTVP